MASQASAFVVTPFVPLDLIVAVPSDGEEDDVELAVAIPARVRRAQD